MVFTRRRLLGLGVAATAGICARLRGAFDPPLIESHGFRLLPESERILKRMVIGLDAHRTDYFLLPETKGLLRRLGDARISLLDRNLFALNFELIHGGLMRAVPKRTHFFVAVPDPATTPESLGGEEALFRWYLEARVGWSTSEIADRVRFFKVAQPLLYPRDAAEVLGHDLKQRLVFGLGSDAPPYYRDPVLELGRLFPEDFMVVPLGPTGPGAINTEGGDLSLSWLPEGRVGLLLGRNRVRRHLDSIGRGVPADAPVPAASIEVVRAAYRKAFFDVEVIVVGEEGLRRPDRSSPELFHLDMVVTVLRGRSGVVAFVPFFREAPVDALTSIPLNEPFRQRLTRDYEAIARQMARRGYRVVRLPFADHPARTPANVGRFVDPLTGRNCVLLGRYPEHFAVGLDGRIPQTNLHVALDDFAGRVAAWKVERTERRWSTVLNGIDTVWNELDRATREPNPTFQEQARLFEAEGIGVTPIDIYPSGEGGIHCLLLR